MGLLPRLLMVFGLGTVALWAAIPAGFEAHLHPVATALTAALGAILGVLVVLVVGEPVRAWVLQRHRGPERHPRRGYIYQVWDRYGVAGLGLLAPLLVGAPLGTVVGIALGASVGRLFFWVSLGIIFWSAVLTFAAFLGLAGIRTLGH